MTTAAAQSWIAEAAHQVQDKRRIYREVIATPGIPVEAIECAKHLVLLCEILLAQSVAKYLTAL